MRVIDIKNRVARQDYVVDCAAVAEALLRRSGPRRLLLGSFSPPGAGSPQANGVRRPR